MSRYYGYRCYTDDGRPLGWLYTYQEAGSERLVCTDNSSNLDWCKRWKRKSTAEKHFEHYNRKFNFHTRGGYLQIEVMPQVKEDGTPQQRWNKQNPQVIQATNRKYNQKRPVIAFRPSPDILEWLEEERWEDENGEPETNAALVLRKLKKLRELECQGY